MIWLPKFVSQQKDSALGNHLLGSKNTVSYSSIYSTRLIPKKACPVLVCFYNTQLPFPGSPRPLFRGTCPDLILLAMSRSFLMSSKTFPIIMSMKIHCYDPLSAGEGSESTNTNKRQYNLCDELSIHLILLPATLY